MAKLSPQQQEQLKRLIKINLDKAVNGVFEEAHQFAQTNDGHIYPEQQRLLSSLQGEIEKIIFEQTMQNT